MDRRAAQRGRPPFLIEEELGDGLLVVTELLAGRLSDLSVGEVPDDWHDFQLAREMGWSEAELEACSVYRRQLWRTFLYAERAAQHEQVNGRSPAARHAEQGAAMDAIAAARAASGYQPPDTSSGG